MCLKKIYKKNCLWDEGAISYMVNFATFELKIYEDHNVPKFWSSFMINTWSVTIEIWEIKYYFWMEKLSILTTSIKNLKTIQTGMYSI